ncbi:MAG TPA: J domain-containing protein [Ilumatobacter sp.]|nr:J domain-containing protein [Ilumatobacter sp.]
MSGQPPPAATVLAELEVYHSRPAQPTRRIALGHLVLPVEPAPGFGGLLLGAVVANHITGVDPDLRGDVVRLIREVEHGHRVVQPRLRHRFQADRHGLALSRHRLTGTSASADDAAGDSVVFDFGSTGSDLAQVLGAVYAAERLAPESRQLVAPVLLLATAWRGPIGPALVAHLAGAHSADLSLLADPRAWALEMLGFAPGAKPAKREVTRSYRDRMRAVHPDHGGAAADASQAIRDLAAARKILSTA